MLLRLTQLSLLQSLSVMIGSEERPKITSGNLADKE